MRLKKIIKREKRIRKIKTKISGTALRPRLVVFRSLRHIHASLIDDQKSTTIVSASDFDLKRVKYIKRTQQAFKVGQKLAERVIKKKIKTVVFDKRGYKFHGRIKALADGARKGGIKF